MVPWIAGRLTLLLFLLIQCCLSIADKDDDYDEYMGIAENENPAVPPTDPPSSLHEDMTKLEKYLFTKTQSSTILPEKRVRLHISPHVENIQLNEHAQTLWISMRVCMFWLDPRVRWNPADFGGKTGAFLHTWEVWSPSLEAVGSVTPFHEFTQYSRIQAKRINDNLFYLYRCPGMQTTVECEIDARAFPYDRQKCYVVLEDKHYSRQMDLDFARNNKQDQEMEMSFPFTQFINRTHYGAWRLLNMTYKVMAMDNQTNLSPLTDRNKEDRMVHVISVTLAREATFYDTTFLIPGLLFLSISALAYLCRSRWLTLQLLSMNLILLALFITSSFRRFPIHYSATPRIVAFWQFEILLTSIQWALCVGLIAFESSQWKKGIARQPVEEPEFLSSDWLRERVFSLGSLFLALSLIVSFVLLTPSVQY